MIFMATSNLEPTHPLPQARPDRDGNLRATAALTPKECTTRGRLAVPSVRVIPVIFIPGTMGSNLCATEVRQERNQALAPGEAAWRPPNGKVDGLRESKKWKKRAPDVRQQILDPSTLDVDASGEIDLTVSPLGLQHARERGWGEIYWSSYGGLLCALESRLSKVFEPPVNGRRLHAPQWTEVNKYDRANWGAALAGIMLPFSESELEKIARYQYPVYAFGYNWLQSNEQSALALKERIESIIADWTACKHECEQVILVTHSMGGLVARACAKGMPEKIAGVIHGVMPAWGAPVAYRRITCGTEASGPNRTPVAKVEMAKFAEIAGETAADTTPVMATAAGVLELLPTHLYPRPWLFASVDNDDGKPVPLLRLPKGNPYDLYRDMEPWYRLIDPALADPARMYVKTPGGAAKKIVDAINQAEKFHTKILGAYYHPHSYAFYGADKNQLAFGACHWLTGEIQSISPEALSQGKFVSYGAGGGRTVEIGGRRRVYFEHSKPDIAGDGTVPQQSGAGPEGNVRQIFRTQGYDHQRSYKNEAMLLLTQHLIARIVQEAK